MKIVRAGLVIANGLAETAASPRHRIRVKELVEARPGPPHVHGLVLATGIVAGITTFETKNRLVKDPKEKDFFLFFFPLFLSATLVAEGLVVVSDQRGTPLLLLKRVEFIEWARG